MNELQQANPLDSAEVFTMPREAALAEFNKYQEAVRRSRSAADKLMAQVYGNLAAGLGVINIPQAIKKAGQDKGTGMPLLAIARADEELCYFSRHGTGGLYGATQQLARRRLKTAQAARRQFEVPEGTFLSWDKLTGQRYGQEGYRWPPNNYNGINRAPVPPIPPQHRPADAKAKYAILWHVEEWELVAPVDPMLLRVLPGMPSIGIVVAHWDLTPVERMVMGAMLGQ